MEPETVRRTDRRRATDSDPRGGGGGGGGGGAPDLPQGGPDGRVTLELASVRQPQRPLRARGRTVKPIITLLLLLLLLIVISVR